MHLRTPNLQPAYILHRRAFANTSLIIELLTPEYGRIALVARGARANAKRKTNQHFLPFTRLLVSWSGRGEVKTLTRIELASDVTHVTNMSLYCGLYINELVMRLTERGEFSPVLFQVYSDAMSQMVEPGTDMHALLRRYECRLLQELGYAVLLDADAEDGSAIEAAGYYKYIPERGPVRVVNDDKNESGYHGQTLIDLERGVYTSDAIRREARDLMREVLSHYLGARPLKSRELFTNSHRITN